MKTMLVIGLLATAAIGLVAQSSSWHFTRATDTFNGGTFDQYLLPGSYLTPPRLLRPEGTPSLVVQCSQGKVLAGYLDLSADVERDRDGRVAMSIRQDGGKARNKSWTAGTNRFFAYMDSRHGLMELLYGEASHKEGKGEPVQQQVIAVTQARASTVVVQFTMPKDPAELLKSCTTVKDGVRR